MSVRTIIVAMTADFLSPIRGAMALPQAGTEKPGPKQATMENQMSKSKKMTIQKDIVVEAAHFHDVPVVIVYMDRILHMIIRDVGRALGYEQPHHILKHIDELDEDEHFILRGKDLRTLRGLLADSEQSSIGANAPSIRLVTQSGAEALAMAAKTPRAKEFRRWIRKVVLPAYRAQASTLTLPPWKSDLRRLRVACADSALTPFAD